VRVAITAKDSVRSVSAACDGWANAVERGSASLLAHIADAHGWALSATESTTGGARFGNHRRRTVRDSDGWVRRPPVGAARLRRDGRPGGSD